MGASVGSSIAAAVGVSVGMGLVTDWATSRAPVGACAGTGAVLLGESPLSGSALAPHATDVAINTPSMATAKYFAGHTPGNALAPRSRLLPAVVLRLDRGAPAGGRLRQAQRSGDAKSANSIGIGFVSGKRVRDERIGNPLADAGFGNLPQQPSPNADAARRHGAKPCWITCARPPLRKGATKTAVAR